MDVLSPCIIHKSITAMEIKGIVTASHTNDKQTRMRIDLGGKGVSGTIFITSDKKINIKKGEVIIKLP